MIYRVNTFSPRLREIIYLDEYLARLAASTQMKRGDWLDLGYESAPLVAEALRARILEMRATYKREMTAALVDLPIARSALGVKGVGMLTFLRFAVRIDIEKADTPAALWSYCGLGVHGGISAPRRSSASAMSVRWSRRAHWALSHLAIGLLRSQHPYGRVRYERAQYELDRGVNTRIAVLRGRRYALKLWLKHLWLVWRRQESLPIGEPHPDDRTYLAAPFGWLS